MSLIFGRKSSFPQFLDKCREGPEEGHETYANWKKDGLSYARNAKQDSKSLDLVLANCSIGRENTVPKRTASHEPMEFTRNDILENNDKQLENEIPVEPRQNANIGTDNYSSVVVARNNSLENMRGHKYPFRDETCVTSCRKNKSLETSVKNGSHDVIKSILKNTQLDRNESPNLKSDRNVNVELFTRKNSLSGSVAYQSPQRIEESEYTRPFTIPRFGCQNEVNNDHDTVRELLLLVQDQSEQIKSLQTQVERLLQTHEQNVGCKGNHCSVTKKLCDKISSPDCTRDIDKLPRNNFISTQNICQHRGTKNPSPHVVSNDQSEAHVRYQGDQFRNTILEKKVSIGVMTSFEFSVQNNPFVPDSDSQINAVLRECGKNMSESSEAWRTNMHSSRNIPGTLENINEDSESHPSSIWKQSSNNTQELSTNKTLSSVSNPIANEIRESVSTERKSNVESLSPVFFKKSSYSPVAAPRNFSSGNVQNRRFPLLPRRTSKSVGGIEISAVTDRRDQEPIDVYRADDESDYEQTTETKSCEYPYLARNDGCPRYSHRVDLTEKSLPTNNTHENSIILSSSDLRVTDRSPPSPDPSIHVEMREYSSDDDNEKSKLAPPVGWTFYKNVVGQVNRILHTIPDAQDTKAKEKINPFSYQKEHDGREEIIDSVKLATLERLKMLGISYAEHSEFNEEHIQKKYVLKLTCAGQYWKHRTCCDFKYGLAVFKYF